MKKGNVGLFISILTRYSEIGTLNYDPKTRVLDLTFILAQIYEDTWFSKCIDNLSASLETFNSFEGRTPRVLTINYTTYENFTVVEVQRDVETLSQSEISLIVSLMRQQFVADLVTEESGDFGEEELILQEELIGHMLEDIKSTIPEEKLIAFREQGRVLVFNK